MNLNLSIEDVLLAQGGDARALDRVIRAVTPTAQAMLRRFPLSEQDRVDVLQNTLLRICLSLDSYRQEARFSTWLYRVCTNEALMLMRRLRVRHNREAELDPEEAARTFVYDPHEPEEERLALLHRALAELPEHYRAVLAAYYGEGRDLDDIATSTVETESAVRARVHRARQLLRKRLGDGAVEGWAPASSRAA
jgi:RNA polymerase sigma-70 factor (ECF subfamily)